jgi:hypothetical protein
MGGNKWLIQENLDTVKTFQGTVQIFACSERKEAKKSTGHSSLTDFQIQAQGVSAIFFDSVFSNVNSQTLVHYAN